MLGRVLLASLGLYLAHSILPGLYMKFIYKEDHVRGQLAFSFDDGPSPTYTPQVLDLLKSHNIRAEFFLVGEKVRARPGLAKRIHQEGHGIGIHCYHHSHPLLWGPLKTIKDFSQAKRALKDLGLGPSAYRPPHGWVNLTMIFLARREGLDIRLWNIIPRDWEEGRSWEDIARTIEAGKKEGGLVLLHDDNHQINSGTTRPQETLRALGHVLEGGDHEA